MRPRKWRQSRTPRKLVGSQRGQRDLDGANQALALGIDVVKIGAALREIRFAVLDTHNELPAECTRISRVNNLHLPGCGDRSFCRFYHCLCRRTLSDLGGLAHGGLWWDVGLYPPHAGSRSDGVRMGRDSEKLNPFQLETGAANLAWALLAFGTVIFGWGIAVETASFLVFGLHMVTAAVIQAVMKRKLPIVFESLSFGVATSVIGVFGLKAAG